MRITTITKTWLAFAKELDIKFNDYVLTPGRYVGIKEPDEPDEPFEEKMKRLTSDLSKQMQKSTELDAEIKDVLSEIGYEI